MQCIWNTSTVFSLGTPEAGRLLPRKRVKSDPGGRADPAGISSLPSFEVTPPCCRGLYCELLRRS